ncbi:MAG TPA: hypothetical protein PKZ12_01875 [Smithellaceae bacterium]|nr:hypothetical protein [Smithellaceae bacterium]
MQLLLSTELPDLPRHKCLALGIFSDEKPPRGIGGYIDWRLNGLISSHIKLSRIKGDFLEKVVIPFPERIATEMLLLFGFGELSQITYDKIYTGAYNIASTVNGMLIPDFAVDIPGARRSNLSIAGITEAMITGFFDFLSEDVDNLAKASSCLVTSSSHLKDVYLGIDHFKANVNDMGSVDISAIENGWE